MMGSRRKRGKYYMRRYEITFMEVRKGRLLLEVRLYMSRSLVHWPVNSALQILKNFKR